MVFKSKKIDIRRGEFYWIKGKPYVSVTNVLRAIDKAPLRYWYGNEIYNAMIINPNLSRQEAHRAPYRKTKEAGLRGLTVHSIVESWKKTGKEIETIPQPFRGYARAFYNWVSDNEIKLVEQEKTVVSRVHRFAGTLDLVMEKAGNLWIVDVKTGKDIYLESHLQISAYRHALEEDTKRKIGRIGILLLKSNGKYKFEEAEDYFDVFLATKKLWEFLNRDVCEKVGYTQKRREAAKLK